MIRGRIEFTSDSPEGLIDLFEHLSKILREEGRLTPGLYNIPEKIPRGSNQQTVRLIATASLEELSGWG
jgi:hypothetical protein